MEISETNSKRITSLRFPLMLLVMIKHNAIVKGLFMHEFPFVEPRAVTFIKEFLANGLGELAVPVFFMFSAYLLASSEDSYITKVKKRFRSLLLPYTIWTVFYFGLWLILKKTNILTGFENPVMDWNEWTFHDYVMRFLGYFHGMRFPFVGSFWFLRDLMVLVIFSPSFLFLTRKFPFCTIATIFLAFVFYLPLPLLMRQSLFYFEVGLVFAVYKVDFFAISDKIRWADLLIAFTAGFLIFFYASDYKPDGASRETFPFFLYLFSGITLLFIFSKVISENEKSFAFVKKLAPLTFFVYAVHAPVLSEFIKKLTLMIGLPSLFSCTLNIGLSLLFAIIFRKHFPLVFAFVSGGKRDK